MNGSDKVVEAVIAQKAADEASEQERLKREADEKAKHEEQQRLKCEAEEKAKHEEEKRLPSVPTEENKTGKADAPVPAHAATTASASAAACTEIWECEFECGFSDESCEVVEKHEAACKRRPGADSGKNDTAQPADAAPSPPATAHAADEVDEEEAARLRRELEALPDRSRVMSKAKELGVTQDELYRHRFDSTAKLIDSVAHCVAARHSRADSAAASRPVPAAARASASAVLTNGGAGGRGEATEETAEEGPDVAAPSKTPPRGASPGLSGGGPFREMAPAQVADWLRSLGADYEVRLLRPVPMQMWAG